MVFSQRFCRPLVCSAKTFYVVVTSKQSIPEHSHDQMPVTSSLSQITSRCVVAQFHVFVTHSRTRCMGKSMICVIWQRPRTLSIHILPNERSLSPVLTRKLQFLWQRQTDQARILNQRSLLALGVAVRPTCQRVCEELTTQILHYLPPEKNKPNLSFFLALVRRRRVSACSPRCQSCVGRLPSVLAMSAETASKGSSAEVPSDWSVCSDKKLKRVLTWSLAHQYVMIQQHCITSRVQIALL